MMSNLNHCVHESKPIHFFKIMLPAALLQGMLRIPGKFVREHGKCLSDTMFLKLPNGAEWKVNLEKHDGSLWIHQGWKEFVEYHSLAHGHLLVFRYDGRSHFHVLIFGVSAVEIDYPPLKKVDRKRANNCEVEPRKARRTNANDKDQSNSKSHDTTAFQQRAEVLKDILLNPNEGKRNIEHTKRSPISTCDTHEAADSADSIMSTINRGHCMFLPRGSLKGYLKPGGQIVTLLVGDKEWKVNLIYDPRISTTCLSGGWTAFARENNLEVGDACSFKWVKDSGDMVMKVSILKYMNPSEGKRNIEHHTKRSPKSTCGTHDAADSADSVLLTIRRRRSMNLPRGSLKGYLKPGGQKVTLLVGDKEWKVNLIYYPRKSTTWLSGGWTVFARENNLRVGDACLFKWVKDSGDMVMKVSILKCKS